MTRVCEHKEDKCEDMDGVVAELLGLASTPHINVGLEGGDGWEEGGFEDVTC